MGKLMPFMYGTEKCQKSESVVIVSSVLDALTLTSSRNLSVIAIAEVKRDFSRSLLISIVHRKENSNLQGPVLLPPDHLPFLEDFTDITFWFPNDAASADTVSVFGRKLGERR